MSSTTLSPREIEVLALAWQCMETEPKINFDKLAELANYTTRASASVTFGNIKRKLKKMTDGSPTTVPTPKTPKSGTKRGAPTGGGNNGTPSKKSKGYAKKGKAMSSLMGFEDIKNVDHGEEMEEIKAEVKKEPLQGEGDGVELLASMNDFIYGDGGYGGEI